MSSPQQAVADFQADFARIEGALDAAIVGQRTVVRQLLTAVLAGGHVLMEGMPGVGKTHLVRALANALGQPLGRVQCTPDLLPSDIVGSEVPTALEHGAPTALRFRPGPIFARFVLIDEINRATPRTQSALLEAMQERQVTHAGVTHPLPRPFAVVATQNPIETEGTYPLPEAQLDRFFFKCRVPYPSEAALLGMVEVSLDDEAALRVAPIVSLERLDAMMALARGVVIAESVKRAAAALVLATQPAGREAHALVRRHVRHGASPRALQALLRAGRVRALSEGRGHLAHEDLVAVAPPVLRHRLVLSLDSEVEGVDVDDLLREIVTQWSRAS